MCYPCPWTVLLPLCPDRTYNPANTRMQPSAPDGVESAAADAAALGSTDGQQATMAIPQLEQARVERALDKFCNRVPAAIRSGLAYEYRFRGNAVLLLERRPHFRDQTRRTEHPFAKFVYSPTVGGWSLRWSDRNGRWHAYEGFQDVPHFRDLLREVEADPTGICCSNTLAHSPASERSKTAAALDGRVVRKPEAAAAERHGVRRPLIPLDRKKCLSCGWLQSTIFMETSPHSRL